MEAPEEAWKEQRGDGDIEQGFFIWGGELIASGYVKILIC